MPRQAPSMKQALRPLSLPRRDAQQGVVLIIALIVLVMITIVTLGAIRVTATDERLASNSRDRDKAFQAADAAVRACIAPLNSATPDLTGLNVINPAAPSASAVWEVDANWSSSTSTAVTTLGTAAAAGLSAQPRCIIERLNSDPVSYRVTGRAVGKSSDTIVMLQATLSAE